MSRKVGRPRQLNYEAICEVLVSHKHDLVLNNVIISKTCEIWNKVGSKVNMSGSALYAFVSNNKNNIKNMLLDRQNNASFQSIPEESVIADETTIDCSVSEKEVDIYISKKEFEDLLQTRIYNRTEAKRRNLKYRSYQVLCKDKWQTLLISKLDQQGIKCGFQFQTHKTHPTTDIARFQGGCKCGSSIRGEILTLKPEVLKITCFISYSLTGESCGKRQLRGETRMAVSQHLVETGKCGSVYRVEQAGILMKEGDRAEPALLPARTVLNQAKSEQLKREMMDCDPVIALLLLNFQKLSCTIHNLGVMPFYVHYWSISQLNLYRTYAKKTEHPTIIIDATGGCVQRIVRPDKNKSAHIFLYECVINTKSGKDYSQFPIFQMLSERQATNNIHFWLLEWMKIGAPPPHEAVSDSCKALLIGLIRAFTTCKTIDDYCDKCMTGSLPECYIRIDVAHTIKIYSVFLKDIYKSIRNLYLGSIGLLIMAESMTEAERILKLLLIVCRSKYQSPYRNCSNAKTQLKKLLIKDPETDQFLTGNEQVDEVLNETRTINDDSFEDPGDIVSDSFCLRWARNIDDKVKNSLEENGDDSNAHFNDDLANKIIKHCSTIPMWSCVVTDVFGYGRKPASSAPVESEFADLKKRVFHGRLPMRVDMFVEKHAHYIENRDKLNTVHYNDDDPPSNPDPEDPLIIERSQKNQSIIEDCFVCLDGNYPSGVHKCTICGKAVHIVGGCSFPLESKEELFEEERVGAKRICAVCHKMGKRAISEILGCREIDNWGGQAEEPKEPTKKRARYIKGTFNEHDFLSGTTLKSIPLLQNGNLLTRIPAVIDKHNYTLNNTCAFDSLFQLLLISELDRRIIAASADDIFVRMVSQVSEKGISSAAYINRARILKDDPSSIVRNVTDDNITVICTGNIGNLASRLLVNIPSIVYKKTCTAGCLDYTDSSVLITMISDINFKRDLEQHVETLINQNVKDTNCRLSNCQGNFMTTVQKIGPMISLDVTPSNYKKKEIRLTDLPVNLKLTSITNDEFLLSGVVAYVPPRYARVMSEDDVGHYKTFSRMSNNSWIESDGLKKKVISVTAKTLLIPSIIMYKHAA